MGDAGTTNRALKREHSPEIDLGSVYKRARTDDSEPEAPPSSPPRAPTPTMPVSRDPQDRDPLAAALRPPIDETEEEKASRIAEEEAARRVSHAIDEAIRQEKQQRKKQKLVRLLLLGQSESGPFRPSRRLPVPYINL